MSDVIAIIVKGGLVMIPLVLCSVIALAVSIERILYWHRISSKQPVEQMLLSVEQEKINEALSHGPGFATARRAAEPPAVVGLTIC